ncbi:MAG TPA: hypothetical protein VLD37_06470 [Candidatus Bilamarchaeum sp.]|nr:hypothetical protein [Candidatus Bilamarchaeum sp.]
MKFKVAGRDVNVAPSHILIYFGFVVLFVIALMAAAVILTSAQGQESSEDALAKNSALLTGVIGAVMEPLLAFLLIRVSGVFKLKNDVALCRSLAGASAFIWAGLSLLGLIAGLAGGIVTAELALPYAVSWAGSLMVLLASSITFYLWLLIFLQPDRIRAKDAAIKAAAFALLYFIIQEAVVVLLQYAHGYPAGISLDAQALMWVLDSFVFGFALLYHMKEKPDREAYQLFAALFVGGALISVLDSVPSDPFVLIGAAEAAVQLGLIYLFSKKDTLKTF